MSLSTRACINRVETLPIKVVCMVFGRCKNGWHLQLLHTSCPIAQTLERTTPKKWLIVWYSTFVPSLYSIMATRCWTEIGFLTTYLFPSTSCNSEHKHSKVSLLTLKLRLNSLSPQFSTMSGKKRAILALAQECLLTVAALTVRLERSATLANSLSWSISSKASMIICHQATLWLLVHRQKWL